MGKLSFIILFCLLYTKSKAQLDPFLAFDDELASINPPDRVLLFDSAEIKKRKIDTAYIIYHPASWAEYEKEFNPCTCPYNDTLSLYRFDPEGRIIQYTEFKILGNYATTFILDSLGNRLSMSHYYRHENKTTNHLFSSTDTTKFKSTVKISKTKTGDSLVSETHFQRFSHGFDTSMTALKKYNKKGRLIEAESFVNQKNARQVEIHSGEMKYHFSYDYDKQGRLIYYRDFSESTYKKISYPFYGRLTETFNIGSNTLKNRKIKMNKEENGVIVVKFDDKQLILTPLEKGSKLFKLRTIITTGEIPLMEYHEFVYK